MNTFLIVLALLLLPLTEVHSLQLPQTGQTASYGARDDGALQKGLATPTPRYIDNGDGSVYDLLTGLIWTKNANCFGPQQWTAALSSASMLASGVCGLTDGTASGDWRLPNIDELESLLNLSRTNPAVVDNNIFYIIQHSSFDTYWSSSTSAATVANAWNVSLYSGDVLASAKTSSKYVWPVRDGYWSLVMTPKGATDFGSLLLGDPSPVREFTIRNYDNTAMAVSSIGIAGPNANEFSVAPGGSQPCTNLTPSLMPGEWCTVLASFVPVTGGVKNAGLNVVQNGKTVTAPLSGTAYTTIMGTVLNYSDGNPLADVAVALTNGAQTTTDAQGFYRFLPPPATQSYDITFSKKGFGTLTRAVTLTPTAHTVLDVGLTVTGPVNLSTPSHLLHAEIGIPYTQLITITGGTWPFKMSVEPGSILPPGLVFNANTRTLSGTPTAKGSYTFTLIVSDSTGRKGSSEFTIQVTDSLVMTTSTLPRGIRTVSYTQGIAVSGGARPYSYSLTGALPAGLTLTDTGNITGTPVAAGVATFTVGATDADGRSVSKQFTIVIDEPLVQTTGRLADGVTGLSYLQSLSATGGFGEYSWTLFSGSLPAGLNLDGVTGIISGVPSASTRKAVVLAVTDAEGRVSYRTYELGIYDPLSVTTANPLPDGFAQSAYSEAITLKGGKPPYAFSYAGLLPAGLVLDPLTGVIAGIPTVKGLKNLDVLVLDSSYPFSQSVTRSFSLNIGTSLTVTTSAVLPVVRKGVPMSPVVMVAQGGASPYTWSQVSGALPTGVDLNLQTGELSGTPMTPGDYLFTVQVTDNTFPKASAQKQFLLHVADTLSVTTADPLPTGGAGVPYVATLAARGGYGAYAWKIKSGTMPDGLTLDGVTGSITGTPTSRQSTAITVEVNDSDSPAQLAEKSLTISIGDTLFISADLSDGRVGDAYTALVQPGLGTPPYSWRVANGILPAGLSFTPSSSTATLTGKPTLAGTSYFDLEVTDSGTPPQASIRAFTLKVHDPLSITPDSLKNVCRTVSYSGTINVTGGALPYRYAVTEGSLPAGLMLNGDTGEITGITSLPDGYSTTFTVTVTDGGSPPASVAKQLALFVLEPPTQLLPLNLATTAAGQGTKDVPYSQSLTVEGGAYPYTFKVLSGSLPAGVSLNAASGVISGVPTTVGAVTFMVGVTDGAGSHVTREFTIMVNHSLRYETLSDLGTVPSGIAMVLPIVVTGGTQPYTFTRSAGTLPGGTALAADGTLGGTPDTPGIWSFTVQVSDADGRSVAATFSLRVQDTAAALVTRLGDGVTNLSYGQRLLGYGAYTWSLLSGALPAGITLDRATGILSGTAATAVQRHLVFTQTDLSGQTALRSYSLTIADPLTILSVNLATGFRTGPYSEGIRVAGGIPPYRFGYTGQLPAGLSLDPVNGLISGIPTTSGSTNLVVTVTDSSSPVQQSAAQALTINVTSQMAITSPSDLPTFRKNQQINPIVLAVRGGIPGYTWSQISGNFPQEISLEPTTGELFGTPVSAGDFTFTVRVDDSAGATNQKEFFLHVSDTLSVKTDTLKQGFVGVPYVATLASSGGYRATSWRIKKGTLPAGLALDPSTGVISGIPTTRQTVSLTVEVSDSDSPVQIAERVLILDVVDILPDGRVDEAYYALLWTNLQTPPYTWKLVAGALPPGLSLTPSQLMTTATLAGKPLITGTYIFEVEVSDSSTPPQTATRRYAIPVFDPLLITTTLLEEAVRTVQYPPRIAGRDISVQAAGGVPPYTYSVTEGSLPEGLALDSAGGISGIPMTTSHGSAFTVTATDSGNPLQSVSRQLSLPVLDPFIMNATSLMPPAIYEPLHLTAQGGVSPYSKWKIVDGKLPPGLTFHTDTGKIEGTPTDCGTFPLTISVQDASAPPRTASVTFHSLEVALTGTGGGSVNSDPSGISVSAGSTDVCSAGFSAGSIVKLMPTPSVKNNASSSFEGWTTDPPLKCTVTTEKNCLITVDSPVLVTALFSINAGLPVRIQSSSPSLFNWLQDAYDVTFPSSIIQSKGVALKETLLLDRPVDVTIKGGYDNEFKDISSFTTIEGTLVIRSGSVTVENIVIR